MFEIGVTAQFEAAHALRGNFGPATRQHGHTYRVEVSVRGPVLQADGTLCDIGLVQSAVREATEALHYRDLAELPQFAGRNSTAEAVAQHLFEAVAPRLRGEAVERLQVRVWESPQAYAAYEGALEPAAGG